MLLNDRDVFQELEVLWRIKTLNCDHDHDRDRNDKLENIETLKVMHERRPGRT